MADCAGFENRCILHRIPGVQIPPSPLDEKDLRPFQCSLSRMSLAAFDILPRRFVVRLETHSICWLSICYRKSRDFVFNPFSA